MAHGAATRRGRRIALALVASLAFGGCNAEMRADITVRADGSGEIAFALKVDSEADRNLIEFTGRSFADSYLLSDVAAAGWQVIRETQPEGSSIVVSRSFAGPADVGRSIDSLRPFMADVRLSRSDTAARVTFDFEATADLATLTDSLAAAIGKDAASKLSRRFLLNRDFMLKVSLRMPGAIGGNDANRVEAGALVWEVREGERRSLSARTEYWEWPYLAVAIAGTGALALLVAMLARDLSGRRRRGTRRRPRLES